MVAVPDPPRGVRNQVSQGPGDAVLVPGAVLGEGFQGFPGGGLLQGQDRLGDGVFLDVQRHGGDPLGEAVEAAAGEGPSEGVEQGLPDGPGELSLGHDASPVLEPVGSLTTYLAGSDQETLLFNTVCLISYCGVFRGNYWVNETGLLGGQFLVIENVGHQVDLAATIVEAEQTQHQRRLLLPHRLIGPAVDDVAPPPNHAQAFQQPNIAADADQEAMAVIEDRPPELIAHKAGIATKQREFQESQLIQQLLQVATLAGIRWPQLPAPRQPQANVPQECQPHLRPHSLGIIVTLHTLFLALALGMPTAFVRARFLLAAWFPRCEPTTDRSVLNGSFPPPHRLDERPWVPPATAWLGVGQL